MPNTITQQIRFRNRVNPLERQSADGRWWTDSDVGAILLKADGLISVKEDTLDYGKSLSSKDFGTEYPDVKINGGFIFIKCNTIELNPTGEDTKVTISFDGGVNHLPPLSEPGNIKLLINECFIAHIVGGAHPIVTISDPDYAQFEFLIGEEA